MKRLVTGIIVAGVLTGANSIPTSLTLVSDRTISFAASDLRAPAYGPSPANIVATASSYVGSPYATIGDDPKTGFSCIGFVHFVFQQNGVLVPYDIPQAWASSAPHVAASDLMPGDVLFYSNTVFAGLSHVAIYIGNRQMIGADNFSVGVHVDNIDDSYWVNHYTGATRPLAAFGTVARPSDAPVQATATIAPTAPPVVASAGPGTTLQTIAGTVGVYSGPGYQYTTITTLPINTAVTVVNAQASWYDVRYQDPHAGQTYGFIYAGDLGPATGAGTIPATAVAYPTPTVHLSKGSAITNPTNNSLMIVMQGPLNVRGGPGKSFAPVGAVPKGTQVLVLAQRAGWARIKAPSGLIGWVAVQYLAPASTANVVQASSGAAPAPPSMLAGKPARVTASMLYVRDRPNKAGHILTVLFAGETVRVLSRNDAWDRVQLKSGSVGWAFANYLRIQ